MNEIAEIIKDELVIAGIQSHEFEQRLTRRILALLSTPSLVFAKHCTKSPELCTGFPSEERCNGCPDWQPAEPEDEMPLTECPPCYDHVWAVYYEGTEAQRDADMAWHKEQVQQVRRDAVKEFAEKCIKGMHILRNPFSPKVGNDHVRFDNTCAKQLKADKAHIRAMAGKE